MSKQPSRRHFIAQSSASLGAMALAGSRLPLHPFVEKPRFLNERVGVGVVGMRYQGSVIAYIAQDYGDIVAVCDVDKHVRDQAKASFGSTPQSVEDYRNLLDNQNVDVVLIGTPDHWHVKIALDALRAGKDVYVEKPLTLTVDEGKILRHVARETGQVLQVGSWQRSDHRFRLAVEMVRQGRLGKLHTVDVVLGKNATSDSFQTGKPPNHINWDLWQGQTPEVPYTEQRCHYTFRWWYEYSGGQMTDWGAHHLDIAQWAIGEFPHKVQSAARLPSVPNGYNVPIDFKTTFKYPNGVTLNVADTGRNGIMFTGDRGRIFVNRGTIDGKPVEDLVQNPLARETWTAYPHDNLDRPPRMGKLEAIKNHMGNFFDCVNDRTRPISDVVSQHRSVTTCHLGNISMRLGRPLTWDAVAESFVDDAEADRWLAREQRTGFEVR